jgi:hypothetical protein
MSKTKAASKKISKTEAIRVALKATKDGSPTLVAKKLNAQGIKVTPQYVSTIKASDKRKAQTGTPNRKPGRPVGSGGKNRLTSTNGSPPFEDLKQASELMLKAVELVLKAGAKEAKQLITMAEHMVDRISDDKA